MEVVSCLSTDTLRDKYVHQFRATVQCYPVDLLAARNDRAAIGREELGAGGPLTIGNAT